MTKKTNTKLTGPKLTEIQTMLYNTLINNAVGLTVSELTEVTGLTLSGKNTNITHRKALDALKTKGLVRIAGFKSSRLTNGLGSGIFQVVNPKAKVRKFKAA